MRGKKAKEIRKEARRHINNAKEEKMLGDVPIAACPQCEVFQWYIELDNPAPHHEYINYLVCANPLCNVRLPMRFAVEDAPTMDEMDDILNPPDEEDGFVPETEDALEEVK